MYFHGAMNLSGAALDRSAAEMIPAMPSDCASAERSRGIAMEDPYQLGRPDRRRRRRTRTNPPRGKRHTRRRGRKLRRQRTCWRRTRGRTRSDAPVPRGTRGPVQIVEGSNRVHELPGGKKKINLLVGDGVLFVTDQCCETRAYRVQATTGGSRLRIFKKVIFTKTVPAGN